MAKRYASRFLANNWVITLTATLIGVFVALYLNERVSSSKLKSQKSIATKNILAEISSNQGSLEETIDKHLELLEVMEFLGEYLDEDNNLITKPEILGKFKNKYPDVALIQDSTRLEDGYYDYEGEINLDLSFPQFNLTTIAWETLKSSGISTSYDFNCLMYLETIDKMTKEILQKNRDLLDFLTGSKDSGENNENLLKNLNLLVDYEESLLAAYESSEEELKACK